MAPPAAPASKDPTARRVSAMVMIVLASILAFVAVLAIWINRQVLNTDNWTKASSQMLERPVIRQQLAGYLTDQLYANVDIAGELRSLLPAQAKALADPAASALRGQVENLAESSLNRPRVQALWADANRAAQLQMLDVLHGGGRVVSTTNGEVVLDLHALLQELESRVGIGGRVAGLIPAGSARFTVLRSDQLKLAQDVTRAIEKLPVIAVVLVLLLFGGALAIAPLWRRNAVRALGIGLIAAGVAALVFKGWAGDQVVSSLSSTASLQPAVREVWSIYTPLLAEAATATIGYGAFLVLGAWLAGPTRPATAVRRFSAPYLREPVIAWAAFGVFVVVVFFWWEPTPATRHAIPAITLIALLGLGFEALRRRTAAEFPEAERLPLMAMARTQASRAGAALSGGARAGSGAVVRQASAFRPAVHTPDPSEERMARLERLQSLHASGVLDDAEFRAEKARILADNGVLR